MPSKYYDVVVIGRSLGALTAAALLARRDFTVLVLGQGKLGANYRVDGRTLRRRASSMFACASPVWSKVMRELAHTQTWRRHALPVDPSLQLLVPASGLGDRTTAASRGRAFRFDIAANEARFAREVEREFAEVSPLVIELYSELRRIRRAADACFEGDAMWPPGGFFERRATQRLVSTLPLAQADPHSDLLGEFPRNHPYRRIVGESVRFATDLASTPPAFVIARLHDTWTREHSRLGGGEQEIEALLTERVTANGGEVALSERATGLSLKRGTVSGVVLDGEFESVGAGFVVTDLSGEAVANLSGGRGLTKRAQRDWPRISPTNARFVVSMIVSEGGIPAPLGAEAILLGSPRETGLRARAIHLERFATDRPEEELLVAEMLLTERDIPHVRDVRQTIIERVREQFPFFSSRLLLVDSVYDGLPLWRYDGGARQEVERNDARLAARAEPMERQFEVEPPGFLGFGGEPLRGPLERTLLCGPTVLPGLGAEGRLLAALGAARIVTKADRRRSRLRREMWTKMEIE